MPRKVNVTFVSLSKKLLVRVVLTSSVVTFLLSTFQIYFEYNLHNKSLTDQVSSLEVTLLQGVSEKLWNFDLQGLKAQMEPVFGSIDASAMKIINEQGEVVYEVHRANFTPQYPFLKAYEILHKSEDGQSEKIGTMQVEFFKDKIVDDLFQRSIGILIMNAIKTAIVASLLLLAFHRLLVRPILQISNYFARNKDPSKVSADRFVVDKISGPNDELTSMIEQIRSREYVLEEWSKKLSTRVEQAEHALEEADEIIKQEKLRSEAAARLAQLGEMAASIAHEINNPLAIIVGYNYLIKAEMNKPVIDIKKINDTIASVEKTTMRISKIINGLRTYARDGERDEFESVAMTKIIEDTVAMTETKMRMQGIEFRFDSDVEETWKINCRSVQIVQVLVALINNAVDAIEKMDEKWISLKCSFVKDFIRIEITDSGHGIPLDVAHKMFEPFFTTKPVGVGTGLGLSISYGIILAHGGRISVDQKCKNTRFIVELPGEIKSLKLAS